MRGPEHAKRVFDRYLQATIPAKCTELGVRLTDELEADPAIVVTPPAFYDVVDHPKLLEAHYPALLTEVLPNSLPHRVANVDEAGRRVWLVGYRMRANVLCRTLKEDDRGDAELNRDRLLLAVMEVMLADLTVDSDGAAAVDDSTVRYLALPLIRDAPGRYVSAGAVEFVLAVVEQLDRALLSQPPTAIPTTVAPLEP